MILNIGYDEKDNTSYAKKIFTEENTYYLGVSKICPRCKKSIIGYPALSRKDNKTEICRDCGTLEALENFIKYRKCEEFEKKLY